MRKRGGHGGGGHGDGNAERWLLTYADMITLLLAFFLILFSISTLDKNKYKALAEAMSGKKVADSQDKSKFTLRKAKQITTSPDDMAKLEKQLKAYIRSRHIEQMVNTHMESRGLVVTVLTDRALYDSGSAELRPETAALIDQISGFLRKRDNDIRVEGNTDNVPIHTVEYPTNWELSTARATTVARRLVEHDEMAPTRISAAGYGEYNPRQDNETPAHRQANRRVDVVILRDSIAEPLRSGGAR